MAGTVGRYARVIKFVKEAEELARSGSLVLDDGDAAIYFLWGQPSHAYTKRDDKRIEGEAALKEIAMDLARPGKVEWNNREVLQVETLRCNAEELVEILQSVAAAGKEPPREEPPLFGQPPPATPPPPVPDFDFDAFPLLPLGGVIWAEVPTNVVHLDVLLGALPTVLVTLEAPDAKAVGLVLRGELFDALAMTDTKLSGREAWDFLLACDNGSVSAFEVSEELVETLPILWRHRVVTVGIESRWFDPVAFADSQVGVDEDRAVIINSSHGVGIGMFRRGKLVGGYSTNRPNVVTSLDPLSELVGPNFAGKVNIIERIAEDEGNPFIVEKPVEAPIPEPAAEAPQTATTPAPEFEVVRRDANTDVAAEPATDIPSVFDSPVMPEQPPPTQPDSEAAAPPAPSPQSANDTEPSVASAPEPDAPAAAPPEPEQQIAPAPQPAQSVASAAEPAPVTDHPLVSVPAAAPEPASVAPSLGSIFQSEPEPPAAAPAEPPPTFFQFSTNGSSPFNDAAPAAGPASDYGSIVNEMMAIGERFLQKDFATVAPILENCEHSPEGLREAITALRDVQVPNQSPERVRAAARAMQVYVADLLSGT